MEKKDLELFFEDIESIRELLDEEFGTGFSEKHPMAIFTLYNMLQQEFILATLLQAIHEDTAEVGDTISLTQVLNQINKKLGIIIDKLSND